MPSFMDETVHCRDQHGWTVEHKFSLCHYISECKGEPNFNFASKSLLQKYPNESVDIFDPKNCAYQFAKLVDKYDDDIKGSAEKRVSVATILRCRMMYETVAEARYRMIRTLRNIKMIELCKSYLISTNTAKIVDGKTMFKKFKADGLLGDSVETERCVKGHLVEKWRKPTPDIVESSVCQPESADSPKQSDNCSHAPSSEMSLDSDDDETLVDGTKKAESTVDSVKQKRSLPAKSAESDSEPNQGRKKPRVVEETESENEEYDLSTLEKTESSRKPSLTKVLSIQESVSQKTLGSTAGGVESRTRKSVSADKTESDTESCNQKKTIVTTKDSESVTESQNAEPNSFVTQSDSNTMVANLNSEIGVATSERTLSTTKDNETITENPKEDCAEVEMAKSFENEMAGINASISELEGIDLGERDGKIIGLLKRLCRVSLLVDSDEKGAVLAAADALFEQNLKQFDRHVDDQL